MRVDLDSFEQFYRADRDPWDFTTSPYEQRKYDLTVASLPRRRQYQRCFEPGCSIGALTARLAMVATEVVALEASPTAAATAVTRLGAFPNVSVHHGSILEHWPDGEFDLIVFSEIGYYWDRPELTTIVERARGCLQPEGHLVGVHWLGNSDDHLLNGSEVHEIIAGRLGSSIVQHAEPEFLLDVWEKA